MTWSTYQPTAEAPWNLQRVVHLHQRAGFSAPWSVIQRDLKAGPQAAIDRLLHGNRDDTSKGKDQITLAIRDAAIESSNPLRLKAWWAYRMVTTTDPLGERLALMWHNHFATSNRKVKNLNLMLQQNELFRTHGRGRFEDLLSSVIKHPAMMLWLDADSNRKGRANENLARELLELFTLGVGNYSEPDVKNSARALTGWTVVENQFEYREARHDSDVLEILGHAKPFTGDQLVEILMAHPATAKRIAWRLCKTFMSESFVQKEKAAVEELAKGLIANDLNIEWAVTTILNSELFFHESNIRSKVLGPAEYVIGLVRALEISDPPPRTILLADWLSRMGLDLFYPPNVGGWSEGRSWLSSRTIVARANFANAIASGELRSQEEATHLDQLATTNGAAESLESKVTWLCKLLMGNGSPQTVDKVLQAAKESKSNFTVAAVMLLSRPELQLG